MKTPLTTYRGGESLNYLCLIAHDFLGVRSLHALPALLSGFNSVTQTLSPEAQLALRNVRLRGLAPTTLRGLRILVEKYSHFFIEQRQNGGGRAPRYTVDDDLNFAPTWQDFEPEDIAAARDELLIPAGIAANERKPLQDPNEPAEIVTQSRGRGAQQGEFRASVEPLQIPSSPLPTYEVRDEPAPVREIPWQALLDLADEFDRMDEEAARQPPGTRRWYHRLHEQDGTPLAVLTRRGPGGMHPSDVLDLSGIRHLIGVPGSGKTTLLYLIAAHAARQGSRAAFFFPSIEVAGEFVEVLMRYNIHVGLLYGQSERSRRSHATAFSASLANQQNGLGVTRPLARYFGNNCALQAFTPEQEDPFPNDRPPCLNIYQTDGNRRRNKICGLAPMCGRNASERGLADAQIWAGHILSIDRPVSPLYTDERTHHFEYLAQEFDLIVIDEVDDAQANLDRNGLPTSVLVGDREKALWMALNQGVHGRAASGDNAFIGHGHMSLITLMSGRFGDLTERMTALVYGFESGFAEEHENKLLTMYSLIERMYLRPPTSTPEEFYDARNALELIWDAAAKQASYRQAFFDNDDDEEEDSAIDRIIERAAGLNGTGVTAMRALYEELAEALQQWAANPRSNALQRVERALRDVPGLDPNTRRGGWFAHYCELMTAVSLLVLQYFGLSPHLRHLISMGLVGEDIFESRASVHLSRIVPEATAGRLSGVRYNLGGGQRLKIEHIGISAAPRLLPQRLHEISAREGHQTSVLLTSATSYLPDSPSYHVDVGPDYLLQRPHAEKGWSESRYHFFPQRDGATGEPLRYSGQRSVAAGERALRCMVDELLKGPLSKVEVALQQNDIKDGTGRKAMFVVNGYAQCEMLYEHILQHHPQWRRRTRYLSRADINTRTTDNAVSKNELEHKLAHDPHWDLLIVPMNAVGRGTNIVFPAGQRLRHAMIGSVYFLTRPHPEGSSLEFLQGLMGRRTQQFDSRRFGSTQEALAALGEERREANQEVISLLRLPLSVSRLGDLARPFIADRMVIILQTIGRAMRGDQPAYIYFVDAAWAPRSAQGEPDTEKSSMLLQMRRILRDGLESADPVRRTVYEQLYRPFYKPLSDIEGVVRP